MFIITIVIFCSIIGVVQADDGCVREENCTLTLSDRGIYQKTCEGYEKGECECVQLKSVNFEYDCNCCSNSTRSKRDVSLEAMFGLKSYQVPTVAQNSSKTDTKTETTVQDSPPIEYKKTRPSNDSCGELVYADPDHMTSELTVNIAELKNVTIRSTHATTIKNCWNLCRYDVLSSTEICTAVGFIEANSQKPLNDCYILSKSPTSSSGKDTSVKIFEICV